MKRRKKLKRLLLIATLASVGSFLIHIYIKNGEFRTILLHFGLNTMMTGLAFGWKNRRFFLENWFFIYLTILFLGGIMEWESSLGISSSYFWAKAIVAAIILTVVTIYFAEKKDFLEQMCKVDILHRGRKWELNGYWDSGNLLRDPYNGKPVNLLQENLGRQIFSEESDYMRLIPYCSLGNANGLLSVYNAEKVYIYHGKECFLVEPAVFGIAEDNLLEGKEYDVILQASMLGKEHRNENEVNRT